jgi:hypothetical protein
MNDQTGLVADFASRVEAVTDFSARAGVMRSWGEQADGGLVECGAELIALVRAGDVTL